MEEKQRFIANEAKVIVISIIATLVCVFLLLISFRSQLSEYVFSSIETDIDAMLPVMPEVVSNEDQVVAAIATVNPSVVSVIVTKDVPIFEQYYETFNPWGPFGGFSIPRVRENGTEEREVGGGSGFIVSSDGLVVTNRHVVDDLEARYSIVLSDGTVYDTTVVDRDPQLDIAILQITELPEERLPVVTFGDSRSLVLGQTVIAIGNALAEFQNSVSLGIVSGLGRSVIASDGSGNAELLSQVIQTDAAINPGNSGGPLLNLNGEVIGVNVATSRGADNIGFALPVHVVEQIVSSVQEYGEIVRPFLGVRYVMITPDVQRLYGLPVANGALLIEGDSGESAVEAGTAAAAAGLQTDDIIIAIDGRPLSGTDLALELRNVAAGDTVPLTILRAGEELVLEVTLDRAL